MFTIVETGHAFSGIVDSVGFGVTPDPDDFGTLARACPTYSERSIGCIWHRDFRSVFVSSNPPPELFRVSESAVVVIRGQ